MPVSEISARLGNPTHFKVKKLLMTHTFRKFFETKQVQMPAPPITKTGKLSKATTRKVTVVQLRNPELQLREIYKNEEVEEKATLNDFLDLRHCFLDMPPEEEVYRAVMRFGKRGLTCLELAQYTGINALTMRHFVKQMTRAGQIKMYSDQVGKSRQFRFVATSLLEEDVKLKDETKPKELPIKCKDEPVREKKKNSFN